VTAAYLGMTEGQLKSQLAAGKTLAQIAPAGKSAARLADALTAAARTKLTSWANAIWNTTWTWGDRDHDGDGR